MHDGDPCADPDLADARSRLIRRWRDDPGGTYRTWFLWEERLKNFRSIRRGIQTVVSQIRDGSFGTRYRGSSLETVVHSVAEQRQIFRGADHAFLWKPKLRIPDIYENPTHQAAFGRFLEACACCPDELGVLRAIGELDDRKIKGLGPAAANLLYFLHPTCVPPTNTAIVAGYNALTGARVKLGRWDQYLAMRAGILRLNDAHRDLLSNDLGAIGGLLFDVGSGRYAVPHPAKDADRAAWERDVDAVRDMAEKDRKRAAVDQAADVTHTDVQGRLRDLGLALGFRVWVARNDRGRRYRGAPLAEGCVADLPAGVAGADAFDAVALIDVLWLDPSADRVVAAFEVEHTTSIYSGIVRLLDLALGAAEVVRGLFLVAPDNREEDVRAQLARPAFRRVSDLAPRYVAYGDLERHGEAMARFGAGLRPLEAIARRLA